MSKKNRERREQNRNNVNEFTGSRVNELKENSQTHKLTNSKTLLALLIIIIAPIVTYWNSLEGEFHFDDYHFLIDNPGVRTLKGVFLDTPKILGTRFVSVFTLYLNYKLDGYNVFYYHIFNLGFHIINCILICFVVLLLLRKVGLDKSYLAFLTSLFFALHPINSEPVNYILHGRFMTLCTMFYLGGFLSFMLAFEPERRKWLYLAISFLCWILSILSKEVGITLPAVLFFYYILFVAKDRKEIIKTSLFFAGGIVTTLFAIWIGHSVIKKTFIMENARSFFYGMPEILTELNVAVLCLSLYLLPLPNCLNVDHAVPYTTGAFSGIGVETDFRTVTSILIVAGLIFWIIWTVRRNRLISFSLIWLFIAHSPTTFVRKGEMISEYRNYLPFFGFAFLSILCLSRIFSYSKFERRYTIISVLIISTLFAFADIERNKVWVSDLTLWSDCISKVPNNPRGYFGLGNAKDRASDYKGAIENYNKAIELDPNIALVYYDRGLIKYNLGDHRGAIEDYNKAIALNPDYVKAYGNRGIVKSILGDYKGAIEDFDKAVELDHNYVEGYGNRGVAKDMLGNYKGGIEDYNKAIELDPNYAEAYNDRGLAKYSLGDYGDAIKDWEMAIKITPSYKDKIQTLINKAKIKINK